MTNGTEEFSDLTIRCSPDDAEIGKALKAIEKDYLKGEVVWDSPAKSARGENLNKHLSQFDHLPKLSAGKDLLTSSAPAEDTRFADVLFVQEEADDDDSSSSTSSSVSSDSSDSSATASLPVEPKVDSALPPPSDWKNWWMGKCIFCEGVHSFCYFVLFCFYFTKIYVILYKKETQVDLFLCAMTQMLNLIQVDTCVWVTSVITKCVHRESCFRLYVCRRRDQSTNWLSTSIFP